MMGPFFRKLCSKMILPVLWTLLTIVLLCLPGSSIAPEEKWINIPHFDKYVHIILFGGIALLWGGYYAFRLPGRYRGVIGAALLSVGLGIVLEFVQLYFIPDRSFDLFDIVADTGGAVLAALFLLFVYPAGKMKA